MDNIRSDFKDSFFYGVENIKMAIAEFIIALSLLIIGIFGVFLSQWSLQILGLITLAIGSYLLFAYVPYKRNKHLRPLEIIWEKRQEAIPYKEEIKIMINNFFTYIDTPEQTYRFDSLIKGLQKGLLPKMADLIRNQCIWYKNRFEEVYDIPILMNDFGNTVEQICELFKYIKDKENNIPFENIDKEKCSDFKLSYALAKNEYRTLLRKIPDEISKSINIRDFGSLPEFN